MDLRELYDLFFLVFTCFRAKKWTFANMMTLKEPVLFLRSENMVTLVYKGHYLRDCCGSSMSR